MTERPFRRTLRHLALVALLLAPAIGRANPPLIDDVGRSVVLPARVERVFAAGPPAAVLVLTIAPDKLIGWPWPLAAGARTMLLAPYGELPMVGRLAGRGGTANVEAVAAAKPDLIMDVGTIDATYASAADRIQQQTGIPYVLLGGRFADAPAQLRRAATLLGVPRRGEELAVFAEGILSTIGQTLAKIPDQRRPRVYYARGPKGLETGLKGSINTEIIEFAGGVNVADETEAPGLHEVSIEQLLRWDPDVIIVESPTFLDDGLKQEAWQHLRAVREHRIYRAPSLPFGWIDAPPGVNRLIGAPWLAQRLYPDHFHFDLPSLIRDFYFRFYGISLTDAQAAALVEGDGYR